MIEIWPLRKKNVLVLLGLSRMVGLIDAASNAGDCAETAAASTNSATGHNRRG